MGAGIKWGKLGATIHARYHREYNEGFKSARYLESAQYPDSPVVVTRETENVIIFTTPPATT